MTTPGTAAAEVCARQKAVVERLEVHRHDDGDARDDVPTSSIPSRSARPRGTSAAGVDDRDARRKRSIVFLDGLVPDGVAREVELVEDEAAHRGERLGDRA